MKKISLLFFIISSLMTCYESGQGDNATAMQSSELQQPPLRKSKSNTPSSPDKEADESEQLSPTIEKGSKIIKDGNISVEVTDLGDAKIEFDTLLKRFNAYYENESYQSGNRRSTYQLNVRVPSENFEQLLSAIESGTGKVLYKNISARDVTEEYVDVAIRLENNKTYLERYRTLLKKANSINDILEIQEKIRIIEAEIDARTGRLNYLDDQVNFSTLRIELFQEQEYIAARKARNFGQQLANAFKGGIDVFLDFLLFLVNLWPFVILLTLLIIYRKRINWRFWKRK